MVNVLWLYDSLRQGTLLSTGKPPLPPPLHFLHTRICEFVVHKLCVSGDLQGMKYGQQHGPSCILPLNVRRFTDSYTKNPIASMDPSKGALAMDTGVQVVANSGAHVSPTCLLSAVLCIVGGQVSWSRVNVTSLMVYLIAQAGFNLRRAKIAPMYQKERCGAHGS